MDIYIVIGVIWLVLVAFFVFYKNGTIGQLIIKKKPKSPFRETDIDKNNIIDRGNVRVRLEFDRDNEINPEDLFHFVEDIEAVIERNRKGNKKGLEEKKDIADKATVQKAETTNNEEEQLNYLNINQLK